MKNIQKKLLCVMLAFFMLIAYTAAGGMEVKAADGCSVSGATYPDWIKQGDVFILKGTVTSSTNMKSLTASLCDPNGNAVYSKTVYPNSTSYNLRGIDAAMRFDKLSANPYTYRVTATNGAGTQNVITKAFTVYVGVKPEYSTLDTSKKYKLCVLEDSSMVVDIAASEKAANVLVKKDVGQATAGWYLESSGDGSYMIQNAATGLYLDVANGSFTNGTNVQIWTRNSSAAQRWYFINDGGAYKIIAKNNHLTLSLQRAVAENKPNVDMWRDIGAAHQRFYLTEMKENAITIPDDTGVDDTETDNGESEPDSDPVVPEPVVSTLSISGANQVPNLTVGQKYSLQGTVTSNYPITKVCAQITTLDGNSVAEKTIYPNAMSASLSGEIDMAMTFNTLSVGIYYYVVSACDTSGMQKTLIQQPFQVKKADKQSKMLSVNWNHITKVGNQAGKNSKGKSSDSCMCFALAYCRTILDGKAYSWKDFDAHGGRSQYDACGWYGKAKYNKKTSKNQNDVFRALYDNINAGKPVMIFVKGRRSSWHYITVVGYQNVKSRDSLSAENFLIIDSCPGTTTKAAENMKKAGYSLKKNSRSSYEYFVAR